MEYTQFITLLKEIDSNASNHTVDILQRFKHDYYPMCYTYLLQVCHECQHHHQTTIPSYILLAFIEFKNLFVSNDYTAHFKQFENYDSLDDSSKLLWKNVFINENMINHQHYVVRNMSISIIAILSCLDLLSTHRESSSSSFSLLEFLSPLIHKAYQSYLSTPTPATERLYNDLLLMLVEFSMQLLKEDDMIMDYEEFGLISAEKQEEMKSRINEYTSKSFDLLYDIIIHPYSVHANSSLPLSIQHSQLQLLVNSISFFDVPLKEYLQANNHHSSTQSTEKLDKLIQVCFFIFQQPSSSSTPADDMHITLSHVQLLSFRCFMEIINYFHDYFNFGYIEYVYSLTQSLLQYYYFQFGSNIQQLLHAHQSHNQHNYHKVSTIVYSNLECWLQLFEKLLDDNGDPIGDESPLMKLLTQSLQSILPHLIQLCIQLLQTSATLQFYKQQRNKLVDDDNDEDENENEGEVDDEHRYNDHDVGMVIIDLLRLLTNLFPSHITPILVQSLMSFTNNNSNHDEISSSIQDYTSFLLFPALLIDNSTNNTNNDMQTIHVAFLNHLFAKINTIVSNNNHYNNINHTLLLQQAMLCIHSVVCKQPELLLMNSSSTNNHNSNNNNNSVHVDFQHAFYTICSKVFHPHIVNNSTQSNHTVLYCIKSLRLLCEYITGEYMSNSHDHCSSMIVQCWHQLFQQLLSLLSNVLQQHSYNHQQKTLRISRIFLVELIECLHELVIGQHTLDASLFHTHHTNHHLFTSYVQCLHNIQQQKIVQPYYFHRLHQFTSQAQKYVTNVQQ